jgi:diaminohydroxyphosphoribosylaminopyrimidine deaminase/5-amino-6-(5-phosphoribosylamino)uracil reductase
MMVPEVDQQWMRRALEIAENGRGYVEPNPLVGAVLIDRSGQFVAEGWHQRFGGPHAEVEAFRQAGERTVGGTLYVTLEPCCHYGKTPPCTEAIIAAGIARVVVAMLDPFPQVAGKGKQRLEEAGIQVELGLCQQAAERLNAPYLKRIRTGLPWVIGKWAMTLDGKIATATGESRWISGSAARQRVHELRGKVDAILVGAKTVWHDDPQLTARLGGPRRPARVVLTRSGCLPETCQLRATARADAVLVFVDAKNAERLKGWADDGAEILPIVADDPRHFLDRVLVELGRRQMTNVLVEGGAGVLGAFHDNDAMDELWVFVAPRTVGGQAPPPIAGTGVARLADARLWDEWNVESVPPDLLLRTRRRRS